MTIQPSTYTSKNMMTSHKFECNDYAQLWQERENFLRAKAGVISPYLGMDWLNKHLDHCRYCNSIKELMKDPFPDRINKTRLLARFLNYDMIDLRRSIIPPKDGVEKRKINLEQSITSLA
jgi:hypothetical protein